MGMKYTKIPTDTFKEIQSNAGIIVDSFIPATGTVGNILCATTGGFTFNDSPTFEDYGADIDNCDKDTKELKKLTGRTVTLGGTGLTVSAGFVKMLMGAADIDTLNTSHVIPRSELESSDFHDLWWIGDYSDKNGNTNGGFLAVHLKDALSTGGFQIRSTDKGKGQFAFTFTAHTSILSQGVVPYDVYVQAGTAEGDGYYMNVASAAGTNVGDTAITVSVSTGAGESYVYQTGVGLYVPSRDSVLTGSAWTAWDGDDEIEADTGLDIVVAIINGDKKAVHAGSAIVVAKES